MTNPTRAEIQAQIEELQKQMETAWPQKGERVYLAGTFDKPTTHTPNSCFVVIDGNFSVTGDIVKYTSLIPAADLIPREEHERLVGEAVNKALNGDLAAEETAYALGAINARVRCRNENDALNVLVKDYANESPIRLEKEHDGHTYRVTVERVGPAEQSEQDSDTPIGYVNLFYDGGIGSVHGSAEEAATVAEILGGVKETAVPLYRHPQSDNDALTVAYQAGHADGKKATSPKITAADAVAYLVKEYDTDTGHQDNAEPRTYRHTLRRHYKVTVHRAGEAVAVAPKGVVEELRSLVYDVIDAARRCSSDPKPSKEYHAAWDAITAALSRITELQQTAVAPKGVVEELRREATRIRKGQSSSHESHARWLDHIAAQITELPEPSEWARGTVVFTKAFWPEPWTDEQCRDLAAALIERAKEVGE